MPDKAVTYQNKIISASVMDDFYNRLNAIRSIGGLSNIPKPNFQEETTLTSQISAIYSAVLSTKNAVSFLAEVNLTPSFAGIAAGSTLTAPNSVSIIEYNIGTLESTCVSYFSSNNSGFSGDFTFQAFHSTVFSTNNPTFTKSANFSSNRSPNFVGNWGSNNGPFHFKGHNSSDSSRSTWKPYCTSVCAFTNGNFSGWCSSGLNACNRVHKNNGNWFSNSGFCSGNHSSHFSGNNGAFFSTHNSPVCSTVHSSNNATVFSTNKTANNSGVSATYTTVWGVYTVEGISSSGSSGGPGGSGESLKPVE